MWLANTDAEEEGVFKDFYNGKAVEYAPWPPDRPYAGGFRYNCMMLRVGRRVGEIISRPSNEVPNLGLGPKWDQSPNLVPKKSQFGMQVPNYRQKG